MLTIRVGILGHFGQGIDLYDGQTVKTREIAEEIAKHAEFKVNICDTYYMKRSLLRFIIDYIRLFTDNDKIIISLSWNGYSKILPLLMFTNSFFRRELFDVVIGGSRQDRIRKSNLSAFLVKKFSKIYVESKSMVAEYKALGIGQVEYMPNFKKISIVNARREFDNDVVLPVCTFSRICKEKGIEDAIKAVKEVNEQCGKCIYELTIFGKPDDGYVDRFNEIQETFPEYIKYGGLVDYHDTTDVLKNYYILLFPTFHDGEGFPGTLIDAFAAGLPTVATNWNCNTEIIRDGYNGFIIPIKSPKILAEQLRFCADNKKMIKIMSDNCLEEAKKYKPETAIENLLFALR